MPPLTPTFPETQTPLIPTGTFPELPNFATKVQEALNLVDPSDMEVVLQKKQEIEQQKAHLTTLLEDLKISQKDYDFSDYEERLLLSDSEIENILENEIFRKDGVVTELGKSFYEYLEVLTVGKSEELKGKMKKKLVKELKLEDRVYERIEWVSRGAWRSERILFENKEQFFRDIKQVGSSGIKILNLWYNYLSERLDAPESIELVKTAGFSGIRSLDLWNNSLSGKLEAQDFITLVQKAGTSGIKSLNLADNYLSGKLEAQDFITLVQKAGTSGIKSLNLATNYLYKNFEATNFILLIQQAWLSGLRSLDLSRNGLNLKFDYLALPQLIEIVGLSGIKKLDLWTDWNIHPLDYTWKKINDRLISQVVKKYNMNLTY